MTETSPRPKHRNDGVDRRLDAVAFALAIAALLMVQRWSVAYLNEGIGGLLIALGASVLAIVASVAARRGAATA